MAFSLLGRTMGARIVFVEINSFTGNRDPREFSAAERATWQHLFNTPAELVHEDYIRFARDWRNAAAATGATFVSADSMGIVGPQLYCANDPIHFNARGSETMGKKMAAILLSRMQRSAKSLTESQTQPSAAK
jgi:hypothetical protein